jgi:hypothetical protein
VLRLKGWILILRGHPDVAAATLRKANSVASDQAAKSWELRDATTLARLLAAVRIGRTRWRSWRQFTIGSRRAESCINSSDSTPGRWQRS